MTDTELLELARSIEKRLPGKRKRSNRPNNKTRAKVRARDKNQCRLCGRQTGLRVHHARHYAKGGSNKQTNLITLCSICEDRAHGR